MTYAQQIDKLHQININGKNLQFTKNYILKILLTFQFRIMTFVNMFK